MQQQIDIAKMMNKSIRSLLFKALKVSLANPRHIGTVLRQVGNQRRSANIRKRLAVKGTHVPPFLIVSITKQCNLSCKGCYAMSEHKIKEHIEEMSPERFEALLVEAEAMGISIILIAGGEPFLRPQFIDIICRHSGILFPVFTNGLCLDADMIDKLNKKPHVIPIISIEGPKHETDNRRGEGVYQQIWSSMDLLNVNKIFFGASITVNSQNFDVVTSDDFVKSLVLSGCKLFFYVEYVPVEPGTEASVLTLKQQEDLLIHLADLRGKHSALFIAFPGDEKAFGGCLAAGRGFVHINAEGGVEPCPFAPYSDSSLNGWSLEEALSSSFLQEIRNNHDKLTEAQGGCALWTHRSWVEALLGSNEKRTI